MRLSQRGNLVMEYPLIWNHHKLQLPLYPRAAHIPRSYLPQTQLGHHPNIKLQASRPIPLLRVQCGMGCNGPYQCRMPIIYLKVRNLPFVVCAGASILKGMSFKCPIVSKSTQALECGIGCKRPNEVAFNQVNSSPKHQVEPLLL